MDRIDGYKFQLPVLKITALCNDQKVPLGNDDVFLRPAQAELRCERRDQRVTQAVSLAER
jgi:hypothetical protein